MNLIIRTVNHGNKLETLLNFELVMNQKNDRHRFDKTAVQKDRNNSGQKHHLDRKDGLITQFQKKFFGQRREYSEAPKHQMPLLFKADSEQVKNHAEGHEQKTPYMRKKKPQSNYRGRLTLPVEEVEIYPEGDLSKMEFVGKEITDELEIVPASLFIKRYIRYKYITKNGNGQAIQLDEQPGRVNNTGIPNPSLLASILIDKYAEPSPLYRKPRHFKIQGVSIDRSANESWTRLGLKKLKALYDHLFNFTRTQTCLKPDETPEIITLSEPEEWSPDAQKQTNKILDYIHSEYTNPDFSVTMIADRLNTSKSALYREWNKHHNESIANYITNLRLEEAKQLLLKEKYPISEVADMSGFSSQSYFTKVFKKKVGVSPTSYQSEKGR